MPDDQCSKAGSEIIHKGRVLVQVGEVNMTPEPETIKFLHKTEQGLRVARVHAGVSLREWHGGLVGVGPAVGGDGYFATKDGRRLNSECPVEELRIGDMTEVVFLGGLRGGGFGGGGKGYGGDGSFGDWTCSNSGRQGCWSTGYSCCRCGAPRFLDGGNSPQGGQGGYGKGGLHQGEVSSGMGGFRVVGPTGRNQQYVPGCDPTQRKK